MGRAAKTTHADRVLIRELWKQGRLEHKLSAAEIGAKFGVSYETIRRVVALDDVEMEQRRLYEEARKE